LSGPVQAGVGLLRRTPTLFMPQPAVHMRQPLALVLSSVPVFMDAPFVYDPLSACPGGIDYESHPAAAAQRAEAERHAGPVCGAGKGTSSAGGHGDNDDIIVVGEVSGPPEPHVVGKSLHASVGCQPGCEADRSSEPGWRI